MTRKAEHQNFLSLLAKAPPRHRQALLRIAHKGEIDSIIECCHNILKGNTKMDPKLKAQLKKYASAVGFVARPSSCWKQRKKRIIQNGGFIPLLLGPIISGVASIVGSLLSRR